MNPDILKLILATVGLAISITILGLIAWKLFDIISGK